MKKVVSAGGVIVRNGKMLFVRFTHVKGITFPKGHVEEGETVEEAALREVREETGFTKLAIVRKLGVVTRSSHERDGTEVLKDIHLFLMDILSEDRAKAEEETEWLSKAQAWDLMFEEEKDFVDKYCQNLGWE